MKGLIVKVAILPAMSIFSAGANGYCSNILRSKATKMQ